MSANCGLVFAGGLIFLAARIRQRWVLFRNGEEVELDLPSSLSLDEATRYVEDQLSCGGRS